jgi:hypothetical protein
MALQTNYILHKLPVENSRLRSKTERGQINEALIKVLCHDICVVIQSMHELGIEADFIGKVDVCLQNESI